MEAFRTAHWSDDTLKISEQGNDIWFVVRTKALDGALPKIGNTHPPGVDDDLDFSEVILREGQRPLSFSTSAGKPAPERSRSTLCASSAFIWPILVPAPALTYLECGACRDWTR